MQEVFKKIIEELKSEAARWENSGTEYKDKCEIAVGRGLRNAIKIVEQEIDHCCSKCGQTNADRIRSMTDEELAKYLPMVSDFICQPTEECVKNFVMNHHGECEKTEECAMKWLQAGSEEKHGE